jgi:hypothetical protein
MNIKTGTFANPKDHHKGWFQFFRFGKPFSGIEIWFGRKYITMYIDRSR